MTSDSVEPTMVSRAVGTPVPTDWSHVEVRDEELQVFVAGNRVGFTVREFQIFKVLAERPDRVVRRSEIHERVWGAARANRDRSVDVFVRKVRRKLAAVSPGWTYVHTHFGIGYRYHPEQAPPAAEGGQASSGEG